MVNTTKELHIKLDASDFTTGAVLSMKCDDGKWHLCTYVSKDLNNVEWNYDVHDKEMLGIMHVLESWQHYLEQYEIWTDHRNLQYFMEAKKLNWQQASWALYLSRFDFNLVYKPGPTMGKANALLRCADHKEGIEHDNENIVLYHGMYTPFFFLFLFVSLSTSPHNAYICIPWDAHISYSHLLLFTISYIYSLAWHPLILQL